MVNRSRNFWATLAWFFSCSVMAQTMVPLPGQWVFKSTFDFQWLPANVPGCVHTDLMKNKIIPDPFYASNEKSVQWVETKNWEYKTTFDFDMSYEQADLVFEGLDTYADIFVNGQKMGSVSNMFVQHRILLKRSMLHARENVLRVLFYATAGKENEQKRNYGAAMPGAYAYTRKAAYEYGWDWGPRLNTCGIWKKVYLKYDVPNEVNGFSLRQKNLNATEGTLAFFMAMHHEPGKTFQVQVMDEKNGTEVYAGILAEKTGPVHSLTEDTLQLDIKIPHPTRWWCHGYGDPYLYSYHVMVSGVDGTVVFDSVVKIGFRTIELVQEKDKEGKGFYFKLNGVPVFCKGANMIPVHSFPSEENADRYKKVVDDAVAVNMNMLRVWGGGFYPENSFYNYCDEKGIMVWQDLMFACSVYPVTSAFEQSVSTEVTQQVQRLSYHACMALWCGNNEVTEGWYNWGWQKQLKYSAIDSARIWKANKKLFEETIPFLLHKIQPDVAYWPSSPSIGWGHPEALRSGDVHYWGVWWGNEPFSNYVTHTGRFMAEYGFQSLPSMASLQKFIPKDSLFLLSSPLKTHQKHPVGFETINTYMTREMTAPSSLDYYSFASQCIQADGMATAIEAHRRSKPYCMGTLYWQLNDCWPVTSWSSVDYYGSWKKFHYDLKRLYATYLISPVIIKDSLLVTMVSDSVDRVEATLSVQLKDVKGHVWAQSVKNITCEKLSSKQVYADAIQQADSLIRDGSYYYSCLLTSEGKTLATALFPLNPEKLMEVLMPPLLDMQINTTRNDTLVVIKNRGELVRSVFLMSDDGEAVFSENYFDLEAGEEKTIPVHHLKNLSKQSLRFMTPNDLGGDPGPGYH